MFSQEAQGEQACYTSVTPYYCVYHTGTHILPRRNGRVLTALVYCIVPFLFSLLEVCSDSERTASTTVDSGHTEKAYGCHFLCGSTVPPTRGSYDPPPPPLPDLHTRERSSLQPLSTTTSAPRGSARLKRETKTSKQYLMKNTYKQRHKKASGNRKQRPTRPDPTRLPPRLKIP